MPTGIIGNGPEHLYEKGPLPIHQALAKIAPKSSFVAKNRRWILDGSRAKALEFFWDFYRVADGLLSLVAQMDLTPAQSLRGRTFYSGVFRNVPICAIVVQSKRDRSGIVAESAQAERAYCCVSLLLPTKPMGNAGFGLGPKAWACRAAPQNLLDFALSRDKVKNGTKIFR
ncbi:hypothetical protein RQM65_03100 [Pricia sp. S334]|uniref:Uncharacterized protein n=1 Tax=Pricia mediterranea TaxID=3076079 RepID=A0ABU3L3I5_9FLAO|nr:hypothetical protein [Pricia sp. S334]MDT7827652.1 hypothetical protein [Pricia sp. S334]